MQLGARTRSLDTRLSCYSQEVNYELELSPQWKGNTVEPKHEDHLVLDIDYYSRATLSLGSFRVEEWLPQVLHVIRRDADSYLVRT